MSDDSLTVQLLAKTMQIEAFIAKAHGMGELKSLSTADYDRVRAIAEDWLRHWNLAREEGALDPRGEEELHKLAHERRVILEKLRGC
jgi:hypothetical protein